MDTDLAKTFLAIAHEGSFVAAARQLCITQTAVTARMQNLEEQLGCRLFLRDRGGARLTSDGQRFITYATLLVETWSAAQRELPIPEGMDSVIALGGESSVCNPLMLTWATKLKSEMPTHAVRIEVANGPSLQDKLQQKLLDAAIVYRPEYWPQIHVEHLMDEKLIQVSSTICSEPYILIDWGDDFKRQHDAALPDRARSGLSFNFGPLALQYILQCGGTGYFRARVAKSYLDAGVLQRVEGAPEFSYPIYLVHTSEKKSEVTEQALEILRRLVHDQADWSQQWTYTG